MSHDHAHIGHADPVRRTRASHTAGHARKLKIVLVLTTAYMLAEVLGGLLTNSLALLADAGHMLTDVLGLAMALLAIQFAQRPATPARTYGFYRLEILAALANALVLFGVAGYILYEAWQRFREPPEVNSVPMFIIAVGGLAVNLVGMRLLHAASSESLNVKGAFLEVLSDLLGSAAVIVAAVVIFLTGWTIADPIISALIGLFILPRTWGLLKNVIDVLLEATPRGVDVARMQRALADVAGVASVHDLHVWTITSGFVAMSGHIQARGRASEDVLHEVQAIVRERFGIEHATLQVEAADHADGGACCFVDPRCLVAADAPRRFTAGAL